MHPPPRRKGAVRRAAIPPDVLLALNEGREETITLVEWLAIDMPTLLRTILGHVGLDDLRASLGEQADALSGLGVTERLRRIGAALFAATRDRADRAAIFERLARHPSDMVRAWAAFALAADTAPSLADRLAATRRFAADRSVAVRECAWDSFRPYVAADLETGLRLLEPWVHDGDPTIHRCAVEGTRPRGVWTRHIPELVESPDLGMPLLEPVRSDPSRYVQNAVANWLNDASKSRPDWVRAVCERWTLESPTPETAWTVNRALRTLQKRKREG